MYRIYLSLYIYILPFSPWRTNHDRNLDLSCFDPIPNSRCSNDHNFDTRIFWIKRWIPTSFLSSRTLNAENHCHGYLLWVVSAQEIVFGVRVVRAMVVEACLKAPTTCLYANLQELGLYRSAREFQPLLLGQGARPELLRSGCLQLKPTQFEDHRIFRNLCSDIDQSVHLSSAVHRPVIVDVQDARPDSVLFSFGIAEKCARHEKILQFLLSGSNSKEKQGLDVSLVSDLMGFHSLAIDMRHLSAASLDDDFDLYEIGSCSSLSQLRSEFYIPKPVLNFVEDLSKNSIFTVHPDGKLLFTGTAAEVKNLLAVLSEFYSKNSTNWSQQHTQVPHFNRMGCTEAGAYMPSSLKLQAVTVAPEKSIEKLKLKTSPRKKVTRKAGKEKDLYMTRRAGKERDLYTKNYFHACESLLSLLIDNKRCRRTTMLSLKKSGAELSNILTQLSTGIAGTGLAVIFSVACKVAGTGVPFSATKVLNTGFGFGLVWLSWAVNELRDAILRITKRSGRVGPTEDEKMRGIDRILNEIMFRASTLMVMAVLRFV
ncbi:uncharacterized protein [Aristolochia californica]|uniref:uncharacterized protein n=1 Tax=Aristolochia californica TaxID=171875 RepID=UPI0035D6CAAC